MHQSVSELGNKMDGLLSETQSHEIEICSERSFDEKDQGTSISMDRVENEEKNITVILKTSIPLLETKIAIACNTITEDAPKGKFTFLQELWSENVDQGYKFAKQFHTFILEYLISVNGILGQEEDEVKELISKYAELIRERLEGN